MARAGLVLPVGVPFQLRMVVGMVEESLAVHPTLGGRLRPVHLPGKEGDEEQGRIQPSVSVDRVEWVPGGVLHLGRCQRRRRNV